MDWPTRYADWKSALESGDRSKAHEILQDARRSIPKTKDLSRWDWFISALHESESAGFVMAVFSDHPIPGAMKDAVMSAGIQHGNASTIKMFVVPCIETFGLDAVKDWLANCGNAEKAEMAEHWFPAARKLRS